MVLVPCYRCNRYHRIVPLGNMLSHHKGIVLKSSRPSLPLKKAPPLTPALFNGLYTPFGSPVCGGQKPQERGRKPPSGAQNRYALRLAGHQSPSPSCAGWDRLITTCFWSSPSCASLFLRLCLINYISEPTLKRGIF